MKPYLIGVGLAGVTLFAVAVSPQITSRPSSPPLQPQPIAPMTTEATQPHRLIITVKVQDPNDLKVKEGDRLKAGQIIASRDREATRLISQKKQLMLSMQKLESYQPFAPTPPKTPPLLKALPPESLLEQEAVIEQAKGEVSGIESKIQAKQQEIDYLKTLPSLDSIILDHEQANLKELKRSHTATIRSYQLAVAKLQTARESRAYREYQASLNEAQRVGQMNEARANYERQLAQYQQQQQDREFQIAQLKGKLQEVDNALPKALRSRPHPLLPSRVLTVALSVALSGSINPLMVLCLLK